ncbi:hypothetical protein LI328DRAFT_140709 [Trichoderma asperelloides]|nr:hypothetical protein LI328DRAFT_140709 [Trichoderma asperelloides]
MVIVPVCMKRSRWMIVAMLAVLKAGATLVMLDHTQPKARLAQLLPVVDLSADAWIIFTLGSTGIPKGVVLQHAAVCSVFPHLAAALCVTPASRTLQASSCAFDFVTSRRWARSCTARAYACLAMSRRSRACPRPCATSGPTQSHCALLGCWLH